MAQTFYLMLADSTPDFTTSVYLRVDCTQEYTSSTKTDVIFHYTLVAGTHSSTSIPIEVDYSLGFKHYFGTSKTYNYNSVFEIDKEDIRGLSRGQTKDLGWSRFSTSSTTAYMWFRWAYGHGATDTNESVEWSVDPDRNGIATLQYLSTTTQINNNYIPITLEPPQEDGRITAATSFTDEGNPSITYQLPSYNLMSSAKIRITWSGGYTEYTTVPLASSNTATIVLSNAERVAIRNASTTSNTIAVVYELLGTFNNGETFKSTWNSTCSIVNAEPTLSPVIKDTRADAINITQNDDVLILGFSTATYSVNATGAKGASIVSYTVENGGIKKTTSTGSFGSVPSPIFIFTVKDSRGNIATKTVESYFVDYKQLTCNIEVKPAEFTSTTTANIPFYISGQYFNGSFGNHPNSLSVTYRYRIGYGEEYSNWITATPTISGDSYSTTVYVATEYADTVYIEVGVGDVLDYVTNTTNSTVKPVFDWSDSNFNFNVPVTIMEQEIPSLESGTSGIWSYRKWTDGTAECWGTLEVNTALSNSSNAGWYSSGELSSTNISFPFTFASIPSVIATVMPTGLTWAILFPSNTGASVSRTGSYQLNSMSSFSSKKYLISYHVRGRWK